MYHFLPLLSFGSTNEDVPDAPVITDVVDNGDADSVTVSLEGEGTLQLYYRIQGSPTWITGLTRIGDGDIIQTGLTTPNWYEFYATAQEATLESPPSNLETIYVAGVSQFSIEEAIIAILLNDTGVTDLVGDRVYLTYAPQGYDMPAIVVQQISGPRDNTLDGPSGLVMSRFQMNSWATKYSSMDATAEAVRKALSGYIGTVGQTKVQGILMEDEGDIPEFKDGYDKLRRMGKRQDYNIYFEEQP